MDSNNKVSRYVTPITQLLDSYSSLYDKYFERYPLKWDASLKKFCPFHFSPRKIPGFYFSFGFITTIVNTLPIMLLFGSSTGIEVLKKLHSWNIWYFFACFVAGLTVVFLFECSLFYRNVLAEVVGHCVSLESRMAKCKLCIYTMYPSG